MTNSFYNPSGTPITGGPGASAPVRAEFVAVAAGFALLPALSGNGGKAVIVNAGETALGTTTGQLALAGNFTTTGAFNTTLAQTASVTLTLPAVTGTLATLAGTESLSNKTLVSPALGTPVSGVLTNCTGTAAGLTAGNVTTNANLTGPITSNGNATAIASQTGSGTKFVMDTSPTLVTPNLGTPSVATLTNATGLPISTGVSGLGTGVATALAVNTGSAGAVVLLNGALGTPSSGTLTSATGLPISTGVSGLGTGVATLLSGTSSGTGGPAGTASPTLTGTLTVPTIDTASGALTLKSAATTVLSLAAGAATLTGTLAASGLASFSGGGDFLAARGQAKASATEIGWAGGFAQFYSMGADASTNGRFTFNSARSDGANVIGVLNSDVSGNITVAGNLTLGASPTIAVASGSLTVTPATVFSSTVGVSSTLTIGNGLANQWQFDGNAGATLVGQVVGSAADIGAVVAAKGAGSIYLATGGGAGPTQVEIVATASATRRLKLTGSNGGNPTIDVSAGNLAITPAVVAASTIQSTGFTTGTATWTLGAVNTVSPTSPNRTLTVTVGGTTYYIAAKTTDD